MLDSFFEDLARDPGDWKLRSVMADWCEDNGQASWAACLRWMIRNHKRPYSGSSGTFTWFNADTIDPGLGDPESDIPGELYQHLKGKESANHKSYDRLRDAEDDIHTAWQSACKGGWKPDAG